MKKTLAIVMILSAVFLSVSAYDIGYPWAGSYVWTCPANNTSMFVNMAGGGGSGASSGTGNIYLTWGYGGSAGEYGNTTMVTAVPGTNYTIVVGAAGANATPSITGPYSPAVSHAGGDSSALGITKHGGAGGTQGGQTVSTGVAGASTNYLSAFAGSPAESGGYFRDICWRSWGIWIWVWWRRCGRQHVFRRYQFCGDDNGWSREKWIRRNLGHERIGCKCSLVYSITDKHRVWKHRNIY